MVRFIAKSVTQLDPLARTSVSALAMWLALGVGSPAAAQQAPADELAEVQITGTRIQQRGDYVSPNPITTVGTEDLQKLGIINVSDALVQIPQNVSQFTPANTGGSAFFVGSTLANLRGLNPFFGTRTLTLVDGRRFIPTTQGDSVDLNFIPTNLIQRMEVVTGGASAAYGSGAISGVVNVILDKKLQGLKLDADYGATTHGDGRNWHVGVAGGTSLFGGRGHVIAGGEYQNSEAIQSCADSRDWCAAGVGFFNNNTGFAFASGLPYTAKLPGQPHYVITSGLRQNQLSSTGVIFGSAPGQTSTFQFNAAGTDIVPFRIGQEGWRGTGGGVGCGGCVVGGDGDAANTNLSLYPEVERKTAFAHLDVDFTDRFSGYVEGSYGQVDGTNNQWETGQNSAFACIRPDNAYLSTLSTAARAAITANDSNSAFATFPNQVCGLFGGPGTVITKNWYPQDNQTVNTDTKVTRAVVGLSGKYLQTWSWDAYYQYGKTTRDQVGNGYRTNWRYDMAIDAVVDTRAGSPTFGQPICRVTLTGVLPNPVVDPSLAQGCQPLNAFGNAASPQALAYAFGSLTEHDDIRQDVIAVSTTGELWQGWGSGPLSAALGAEYRKDSLSNDAGGLPFAQRTDFGLQYGDSFAGKTEVTEEFLELEMAVLKDLALARNVTLNVAGRHAEYKTEGGLGTVGGTSSQDITTWKIGGSWDVVEWLRFRGSRSHDIRAAGFRELFYSQSVPAGGFFGSTQNPWINVALLPPGSTAADPTVLILNGNPAVEPEEATTTTVGFVLSGSGWADRAQFSADYYRIKLTGGLALGNAQDNVNRCFAGETLYCQYLTFGTPLPGQGPNSNITALRAVYLNQSPYETKGIDFAFDYSMPLNGASSLAFRLTASHTLETIVPSGRDVAGQTGGDQGFLSDFSSAPDWSGNLTVSYSNGPFVATAQARYVASGVLDLQNPKTGPDEPGYNPNLTYSVNNNHVASYALLNLTGSYDFKWFDLEKMELFVTVNNVLDKDPPFSAGAVGGANAVFFDALGRSYRLGMRLKF